MKATRVLHVISRMNSGGTATYLNTLIPALEEKGIECLLAYGHVARGETEDVQLSEKNLVKIPSLGRSLSPINDFRSLKKINGIIKNWSPDIVHSHAFKAGMIVRTLKSEKTRRIHTFHGHHLYDPEFSAFEISIMNYIERVLTRRTDGFFFIGNKVKNELSAKGIGIKKPSKCTVPGIYSPRLISRSEALLELDLQLTGDSGIVALWMGRMVAVKRPWEMVDLARAFPQVDFLIAGNGPMYEQIRSSAPINLHCLGWKSKELLLSVADIVVSTSESEGMPLTLIEAQMSGIPVIATDVGSVSEVFQDHISGLLVEKDLNNLHTNFKFLMDNPSSRHQYAQSASRNAKIKFSVDQMAEAHTDFYERILVL